VAPGRSLTLRQSVIRIRVGAAAGLIGPAAFTLAWILASFRQPGLPCAAAQISGLAADNAVDPWIMISGFLLLGGCAVAFGAGLAAALGGQGQAGPGPLVIEVAGVLTIAAGLLRRDHVLLTAGPESWHNHAHDVVSAVVYVLLITTPLLLARRFRRDRRWPGLAAALIAASAVSAALLVAFYSAPHDSWDGTLQRIAISLPLAAIAAVAARLATTKNGSRLAEPDQELQQPVVLGSDEAGEARVADVPIREQDRD
jgi:hypothetical membrane protein